MKKFFPDPGVLYVKKDVLDTCTIIFFIIKIVLNNHLFSIKHSFFMEQLTITIAITSIWEL